MSHYRHVVRARIILQSAERLPVQEVARRADVSRVALTRRRLRRGIFRSVADLQAAINRHLKDHNNDPKPFVWTKSADTILAKTQSPPAPFNESMQ